MSDRLRAPCEAQEQVQDHGRDAGDDAGSHEGSPRTDGDNEDRFIVGFTVDTVT